MRARVLAVCKRVQDAVNEAKLVLADCVDAYPDDVLANYDAFIHTGVVTMKVGLRFPDTVFSAIAKTHQEAIAANAKAAALQNVQDALRKQQNGTIEQFVSEKMQASAAEQAQYAQRRSDLKAILDEFPSADMAVKGRQELFDCNEKMTSNLQHTFKLS